MSIAHCYWPQVRWELTPGIELAYYHERIHWLLLISGHLLADECQSERVSVPEHILRHANQEDAQGERHQRHSYTQCHVDGRCE